MWKSWPVVTAQAVCRDKGAVHVQWINQKAQALTQGAIRAMFDRANTMTNVISMGIGEPDMATPALVREAGKEALDKGITHYTPNVGTMMLRQAIAEKSTLRDLHYDPSTEIIITNGGMGALSLLFLVKLPAAPSGAARAEDVLCCARQGLRFLKGQRGILHLILFLAAINFTASVYNAAFPAMGFNKWGMTSSMAAARLLWVPSTPLREPRCFWAVPPPRRCRRPKAVCGRFAIPCCWP